MKSYADFVNEAKARVRQLDATETARLVAEYPDTVLIDCREPNEWNLGHIPGAVFIPRGVLEQNVEARIPRDRKVVVYCASGNRSALAADRMTEMGYTDVASMRGGFRGWCEAGGDVEG
jgi:rhodanese-related sulfurtransferase